MDLRNIKIGDLLYLKTIQELLCQEEILCTEKFNCGEVFAIMFRDRSEIRWYSREGYDNCLQRVMGSVVEVLSINDFDITISTCDMGCTANVSVYALGKE